MAAEAVQREDLDRPRADVGDRQQAPRRRLGQPGGGRRAHRRLEVGAPGGDLDRHPAQRDRPLGSEVERREPRRGERRHRGRRRPVAQPGLGAAVPEHGDQPPLDRDRALELDQLLGHRGQQRLPRQRPAADPQPRVRPDRLADHRVGREALVERPQVVVDPGREAHPGDPVGRGLLRAPRARRTARGRAPAARCRRARAHRRRAAAAAATRRAGASARRQTRRRAGTATAARPRRGARRSILCAQQVDVDQERVGGSRSRRARSWPSCACAAARGCGGGARRRPSRSRPRTRSPPAPPPGGRARRPATPARPRRAPPGTGSPSTTSSSWKSSGVSLTNPAA